MSRHAAPEDQMDIHGPKEKGFWQRFKEWVYPPQRDYPGGGVKGMVTLPHTPPENADIDGMMGGLPPAEPHRIEVEMVQSNDQIAEERPPTYVLDPPEFEIVSTSVYERQGWQGDRFPGAEPHISSAPPDRPLEVTPDQAEQVGQDLGPINDEPAIERPAEPIDPSTALLLRQIRLRREQELRERRDGEP